MGLSKDLVYFGSSPPDFEAEEFRSLLERHRLRWLQLEQERIDQEEKKRRGEDARSWRQIRRENAADKFRASMAKKKAVEAYREKHEMLVPAFDDESPWRAEIAVDRPGRDDAEDMFDLDQIARSASEATGLPWREVAFRIDREQLIPPEFWWWAL